MQRLYGMTLPILLSVMAIEAIPTIPALSPATPPTSGIVATDDGHVYFIDSFHNTVWRIRPDGTMSAFVTGRAGRSLQLDSHGNLYGTHQEGRGRVALWRADPWGVVTDLPQSALPQDNNHAFSVGDAGEVVGWAGGGRRSGVRLWRAQQHRRQLVAGGDWGLRDGRGAAARFHAIGAMTRTDDGDLIVTSGSTVRRICRQGEVSTVAAGDPLLRPRTNLLSRLFGEPQSHLSGVAVAGNGDIYVANSGRDAVVRVSPDGSVHDVYASEPGWTPTGVAIAGGNIVYVLEYGQGVRVRRLGPGSSELVALVRPTRALAHAAQLPGWLTGRV